MVDVDARLAEIEEMVIRWMAVDDGRENTIPASPDDVLWLLAVLKEQAGQIERLQREATETVARSGGELLRGVTSGVCDWTQPNCVRRAAFRLATPHGHMDFCPEHIDYAIASMPTEWVEGWSYREPLAVEGGPDDIPF